MQIVLNMFLGYWKLPPRVHGVVSLDGWCSSAAVKDVIPMNEQWLIQATYDAFECYQMYT